MRVYLSPWGDKGWRGHKKPRFFLKIELDTALLGFFC